MIASPKPSGHWPAKSNKDPVMANINLNDMSLAELKSLQKDVEKAIADYTVRKKTEAMAAREARPKVLGFSLAELTG
jgi:DNA-binding protein H-NS